MRKCTHHSIIEAVVEAIIASDSEGRIVSLNASACAMFGYERGELMGESVNLLMPGYWARRHDAHIGGQMGAGIRRIIGTSREVRGLRRDGSAFPIHLSIGSYSDGDQTTFVGVVHDMSRRARTERTLRETQKMEALGQMTAGLAHDFNNLLTVITGNLELLEGHMDAPQDRETVLDALEAAQQGAELVRRMLEFARHRHLEAERAEPVALVRELIPMLERTLGPRTEMILHTEGRPGAVHMDSTGFETALLNLAMNSRDAMPRGGRFAIEICPLRIDDDQVLPWRGLTPGEYVRLSVSDTGTGMSSDVRRQAMEPFFTTKERGNGAGLGLATVYGFVRQSGGHVEIYSEPGLGTTVNMYLPRADESAEDASRTVSSEPPSAVPRLKPGLRVLLVEDDFRVRVVTAMRLKNLWCKVVEASSAAEAMAILATDSAFDLVFTDLAMPGGKSGLDLCDYVAEHHPAIARLLTSGYAEDVMHDDELASRGLELLRKPYRNSDLARALAQVLRGADGAGSPPSLAEGGIAEV